MCFQQWTTGQLCRLLHDATKTYPESRITRWHHYLQTLSTHNASFNVARGWQLRAVSPLPPPAGPTVTLSPCYISPAIPLHITHYTQHLHCHQDAAVRDHTHAVVTLDIKILSLFYLGDKNNLPELIFIRSRHCQGGCWPQLKLEIIKRELYFYCIFLH